jgi:hypothetical protein
MIKYNYNFSINVKDIDFDLVAECEIICDNNKLNYINIINIYDGDKLFYNQLTNNQLEKISNDAYDKWLINEYNKITNEICESYNYNDRCMNLIGNGKVYY